MIDADALRPKTRDELRKFGLTLGPAFAVLGAIFLWRDHVTPAAVLAIIAATLLVGGLVLPQALGPVERAWMGLARALSKVTTPIFMGIVYFVVLSPFGLIRRTVGRNPLKHEAVSDSYWTKREDAPASDLRRQF